MSTDSFTTMIRGFDVTVEAAESSDTYKVHVVEGGGVPWTVELPINLENFEGQEDDDVDGSNELLTLVAEAAVDLFESSRDTLGQGAGALEVAAMKKTQGTITACGSEWQDYYLQLKGTTFEGKAEELVKQWLDLNLNEPEWEDKTKDLRKEKQKLIYELNLLELELLKNSPEQQMLIIMAGRKRAYLNDIEIPLYLDIFAGSPQEAEAVNIMKGILDIDERIQSTNDTCEGWDEHWKQVESIEMQLQDLILTSVQEHAIHTPSGAAGAPNMANDIAELMEGIDLHAPLSARKRAQLLADDGFESVERFGPDESADPYEDGYQAGLKGSSPADNPYRGDSGGFDQWVEGLNDARSKKRSRRAFEEFETAEDRETEGGEIRHDLDTGCIDPEDYKFEPNQKVTLNKKLELMIGGGVPKDYAKGTSCVVESRYDGEGDFYYVRFEDGQMARVLFSDLTGGKKKESSFFGYMEGLLEA